MDQRYVDGFVLPIRKDGIEKYKEMATTAATVWLDHGALEYRECLLDDGDAKEMIGFPALAGAKEGETVVLAYIVYKSREDRDQVTAKVMADPRLSCEGAPFDYKRMAYGGFTTLVKA